jgi:hypothetical protein
VVEYWRYDLRGKTIKVGEIGVREGIPVEELPAGTYFLRLGSNPAEKASQVFIKN